MPQPVTKMAALATAASEAIDRRDWAALRFNATLMVKADPADPLATSYLGVAYLQLGLEGRQEAYVEQAMQLHREAVRLGPRDAVALGNLGLALMKVGKDQEALEVLAAATKIHPEDADFWGFRAQTELETGRLAAADRSVRRLLPLVGKRLVVFELDRLYLGDHQVSLIRPLSVGVRQIPEGYACEENEFEIHGTGRTFKSALVDLCKYFAELYLEYVETDDALDEGAEELAGRLRRCIATGSLQAVLDAR